MNTPARLHSRYTLPAIGLHWLLAIMIIAAFGVGLYVADLPVSPQRLKLMSYHKWAGVTILLLSAIRLLWRLKNPPPPDAPMPAWQARLAHITHGAMYLLFFAVPLAGWAYSSAAGFPVVWFGVVALPDFVPVSRSLAESIKPIHSTLAFALAGLVVIHLLGVMKHQLIDRDGLMARMLPWNSTRA